MNIFLAILSIVLLFGMIGDKEQQNRNNFTWGFIATIIGIVALYMVG